MLTSVTLQARPEKSPHELERGEWRGFAARLPCGHLCTFYRHYLDPRTGLLSPSVVCPRERFDGCDGHYEITLAGNDLGKVD